MPEVSVILPAYNRRGTIGRALRGIRAQQIGSLEVIVADDASTDGTPELAAELEPAAKVVRLAKNSGAAAARNAALALAAGKYLAFLDSDDEWLPGKIAKQVAYLEANPGCGACATGHELVHPDGTATARPGRNFPDWRKALHRAQSFHGASTPLVRREVYEAVGGQDERLRVLEDWDWMLRIACRYPVHVLEEPLARIHENRPSDPDYTMVSTCRFLKKHRAEFARYGWRHHRETASQHWENAARNQFLHGRNAAGLAALLRSLALAPWRNPLSAGALPLAVADSLFRTALLPRCIARRSGASYFPPRPGGQRRVPAGGNQMAR